MQRLILTASGGPFRKLPAAELASVTREQALKHPTWNMGEKITIDSATLFNKGLEMIEARWLFDVEMARVDVIVHPQSIVHSMVEFVDGSVLAQLVPLGHVFSHPICRDLAGARAQHAAPARFRGAGAGSSSRRRADGIFPRSSWPARRAKRGGTLPAVLNAANEVAVAAFSTRIPFPGIWETVAQVMDAHERRCARRPR